MLMMPAGLGGIGHLAGLARSLSASGFSHSTGLPAAISAMVVGWWMRSGVTLATASNPPQSSAASSEVKRFGML